MTWRTDRPRRTTWPNAPIPPEASIAGRSRRYRYETAAAPRQRASAELYRANPAGAARLRKGRHLHDWRRPLRSAPPCQSAQPIPRPAPQTTCTFIPACRTPSGREPSPQSVRYQHINNFNRTHAASQNGDAVEAEWLVSRGVGCNP